MGLGGRKKKKYVYVAGHWRILETGVRIWVEPYYRVVTIPKSELDFKKAYRRWSDISRKRKPPKRRKGR